LTEYINSSGAASYTRKRGDEKDKISENLVAGGFCEVAHYRPRRCGVR
jgi:hypothetical protein